MDFMEQLCSFVLTSETQNHSDDQEILVNAFHTNNCHRVLRVDVAGNAYCPFMKSLRSFVWSGIRELRCYAKNWKLLCPKTKLEIEIPNQCIGTMEGKQYLLELGVDKEPPSCSLQHHHLVVSLDAEGGRTCYT